MLLKSINYTPTSIEKCDCMIMSVAAPDLKP